jgi:hypothetical protein
MSIHYWPEGPCPDVAIHEKRGNWVLRQEIDNIMLFLRHPQQMTVEQVQMFMRDRMVPPHVIRRLTGHLIDAPIKWERP